MSILFPLKDVPMVLVTGPEEEDGGQLFRVTVTSIPAACRAQWRMKEKNGDEFKLIDANDEDYKGTSNSLPNPVLVVKQKDKLANYCFEIEVQNFIGSCKKTIPGKTNHIPVNLLLVLNMFINQWQVP